MKKRYYTCSYPYFLKKSYLTLELTFDLDFCLVTHQIFLKVFSMLMWMYL